MIIDEQQDDQRHQPTLMVLKDLIDHQGPGFFGEESRVLKLFLTLRSSTTTSRISMAAIEAMSDSFFSQLEPLYALGSLRSALRMCFDEEGITRSRSLELGMRLIPTAWEQLPSEVVQEELMKGRTLIRLVRHPLFHRGTYHPIRH